MKNINPNIYKEWLTAIASTRLLFNTMSELETLLDNNSIHNNGIRRCYNSHQKSRAAFRDLKEEISIATSKYLELDSVMTEYKKAWLFYKKKLMRRSSPEKLVFEILTYFYPPYRQTEKHSKYAKILDSIMEKNLCVPILVLLLKKAIPGYDSKDGDVVEMNRKYEEVIELLDKFTGNGELYTTLPIVKTAKEEPNKSRIMLLYYTFQILDIYQSYCESNNIYDTARSLKESRVSLDIAGYWNDCNGKMNSTTFWEIEEGNAMGEYFMTKWQKKANDTISRIQYTFFLNESTNGNIIAYVIHPKALSHIIHKQQYCDSDHVWYETEIPTEIEPKHFTLKRLQSSYIWKNEIHLTKVCDENCIRLYEKWIDRCTIENPYSEFDYVFNPNIYAITTDFIYIPKGDKGEYYQVPKDAHEGFEQIQTDDNVGILTMGEKSFLAFDDLLLYIPINKNQLRKYGIKIVTNIE